MRRITLSKPEGSLLALSRAQVERVRAQVEAARKQLDAHLRAAEDSFLGHVQQVLEENGVTNAENVTIGPEGVALPEFIDYESKG